MLLSRHYIDGPVGLGVNYGLGTWYEDVLIKQRMRSMFKEALHDQYSPTEVLRLAPEKLLFAEKPRKPMDEDDPRADEHHVAPPKGSTKESLPPIHRPHDPIHGYPVTRHVYGSLP